MIKKVISFVLTLILGAAIGIGGLAYLSGLDAKTEKTDDTGFVQEEVTLDPEIIKDTLSNVGEMVTQDYDYTALESYESQLFVSKYNIKLPFSKSKFTITYDGTIKAGIDFTKIKIDVNEESKKLTLTLPKAYIISSEIDNESLKVLDEKNSVFNKLSFEDFNFAEAELKEEAQQEAIDKGILKKAQKNAEVLLSGLLQGLPNISHYKIEIKTEE